MTVEERLTATALGHAESSQSEIGRAYNLLAGVPSFPEANLKKIADAYHSICIARDAIRTEIDKTTKGVKSEQKDSKKA